MRVAGLYESDVLAVADDVLVIVLPVPLHVGLRGDVLRGVLSFLSRRDMGIDRLLWALDLPLGALPAFGVDHADLRGTERFVLRGESRDIGCELCNNGVAGAVLARVSELPLSDLLVDYLQLDVELAHA